MNKNKEELKLKIQSIFTKLRNVLNEREDKLLLDMLPPKEEFLESFQENENDENSNNLDLNGILNSNKGKNYYNNNGEYPSFKNNSIDNYNNYFNDNNQIIDDNLIEYPKSEIKIDEDHYSFAKENKKLKEKYQNSILNKDTLLDKTEEDNEKYNSIGSEPYNTSNSSIFQNSGYIGTVGNILHTVWDTGVQATSGVREKMNEYTLGKGVLYIGGKLVEGAVYIGGKIYEKSVDIINSEMTRNIFNKAGEGISYISQKITKNKNNGENNENNNYIDISDNINYDKNKNYIKHSDIENNYNILNDKRENFYILESLVDTFAYLQQIGICHRDIKPQNILCFGEKGYKISDFGEAKYRKKWRLKQTSVNYTSMQTVRGTELYMSPILYSALKSCPNKGANHNVFKSDVFSLGMCFLFASCLDYKSLYEIRKVNNMKKLTDLVEHCVNGKYSQNFIDILLCMLQINEKERPDFIELSSII